MSSRKNNSSDIKIIARINTSDYKNKKRANSVPRIELPTALAGQLAETARQVTSYYSSFYSDELRQLAGSTVEIHQNLIKSLVDINTKSITESVKKIAESATKGIDRHLPNNWPDELSDVADLCIRGTPVIFVPRADIVSQILKTKSMASTKRVLVRKAPQILEDCEKVLAECNWITADMRKHIQESIDCYKDGYYRAAQSTATIAFDSILNDVVDMKSWRIQKNNKKALSASVVGQYTNLNPDVDLMAVPLGGKPFYTLLMLPIIGRMLTKFELADKKTYGNDANRHIATHTVSSKQYKKSNALLTIMTVVSICKVTQLNGKFWIQSSTEHYGFKFVEKPKKSKQKLSS